MVYAATGLPQSLSFDATTRTISGTPSVTAVATVVVSASNAAGQVSGQFTLTVNPAPVVAPSARRADSGGSEQPDGYGRHRLYLHCA